MRRCWQKALAGLGLVALLLAANGCTTTEPDNASERPWNSPAGWQYGVPGMDPYGRY